MSGPVDHAIELALNGVPVFPCWPQGSGNRPDGRPLYKSPHVSNWGATATTDLIQVMAWWQQWPDALVAVPTGARSGLYVLDVDLKPDVNGANNLVRLGLIPTPTRIHRTLTGGTHHLYQMPTGGVAKTDASVIAPGVDRRGDGGYIIWWPAHGGAVVAGMPAVPPDWMVQDVGQVRPDVIFPPVGLSAQEICDLLARVVPAQMDSRSEWIKVGMALHHETEGGELGLDLWDRYSRNWPKYEGTPSLEREWATFGRGRGSHISIRSLMPKSWQRLPTEVGFGVGVEAPTLPVLTTPVLVPPPPGIAMMVPPIPGAMVDARGGTATSRPLTEAGNAMRMQDAYGDQLRYVIETKSWLYWDNGAWHWDVDGAVPMQKALNLQEIIYRDALTNLHETDLYYKWALKSQEVKSARASVAALASSGAMRVSMGLLDHDVMMAGLDGGRTALDLHTGAVRPARPDDYITKSLGVREVGNARDCPRWQHFLTEVFMGDMELIEWLQRWCGYMLTGKISEQFFCFGWGSGRNGKGTFSDVLQYIMGDYSRTVSPASLTEAKRSGSGANPDIAALAGARLALSSETNDGTNMNEGLVKNLTGGDAITARQLYGLLFEFRPQFKLFICGNHKPDIKGTEYAIWARVRLIPFLRTFLPHEVDVTLGDKLRAEAPHILAWMLEGCLQWQKRGLRDIPASIDQATQAYKVEMDTLGYWLDEKIGTDPARETVASLLYLNYRAWALENGHKFPMTNQTFARLLIERGFTRRKNSQTYLWSGIYIIM